MSIEDIDKEQIQEIAAAGGTVPASLLLILIEKIEKLEAEIAGLKRNSATSSKPPSSDRHNPNKPDKKPRGGSGKRKKKRKPGGQKGHKGETLQRVAAPEHTVDHLLPDRCTNCAGDLREVAATGHETRQVFDLPEKIEIEVTEHRAQTAQCPCCHKKVKATFPKGVLAPAQYGERLGELFKDIFGHGIATGSVSRFLQQGGEQALPVVDAIKKEIREGPFIHSDETGLSVSGKLSWLHTAATSTLTYLHVDEKRGIAAIENMGVLIGYTGFAIHDYFASYYKIEGLHHSLCNAHHLRDLDCVAEGENQGWATEMRELLIEGEVRHEREERRGRSISLATCTKLEERYHEILDGGYKNNPEPKPRPGQRGRVARGKALNLLDRFRNRWEEVLGYLIYDTPFDNNQAERDLRMMKTKQKISGCFRSMRHAQAFANLRSVIATAKKRKLSILEMIKVTLADPSKAQKLLLGT